MNQVVLKAQADGNNWDYWAEEAPATTPTTPDDVKNFTEQYILPYMIYHKYEIKERLAYVYLNDGTLFTTKKGSCIDFTVDINGDKKPNKKGRDKFYFMYCPESTKLSYETRKIITFKLKSVKSREQILNSCKSTGLECSALLEMDGWQFKDDYPYHI